jgi:hypothetical protein
LRGPSSLAASGTYIGCHLLGFYRARRDRGWSKYIAAEFTDKGNWNAHQQGSAHPHNPEIWLGS